MKAYLANGGAVMLFLNEGGDVEAGSNVNDFLEEYGISVNGDSVLRTVYYKYLHPKEVFISSGVLHPELVNKKSQSSLTNRRSSSSSSNSNNKGNQPSSTSPQE